MGGYETLRVTREGHLTWCTLHRPDSLNALDRTLVQELRDFFSRLPEDTETRVVVLRGQRRISEIVMLMQRAPQPIIAAVHGPACGGGFALALAADVRVAGESARMNAAFIRLGLSACDVGVSYFLPRLVGASVAAELLLTGSFIDAARAERVGLVSRVVPDAELEGAARALANDMLRNTPLGLRLTKECLRASLDAGSLEQVIAMEDRNQVLCVGTEDFREGIAAFLQKRPARFRDA
jgi:enoyl-CoA hydratase/carnithine racemase